MLTHPSQNTSQINTSLVQGVQGGIDSQSLETILELKDIDLRGIDTATSRLNSQLFDHRGNSSSLSNFVLPQTTTRTMKTNRSHLSNGMMAPQPQQINT